MLVFVKASSHMEDSMIASHLALLIGCVLQQNEVFLPLLSSLSIVSSSSQDHVRLVRSLLPDDNLALMVEQLQRYLEFLRLAVSSSKGGGGGVEKRDSVIHSIVSIVAVSPRDDLLGSENK